MRLVAVGGPFAGQMFDVPVGVEEITVPRRQPDGTKIEYVYLVSKFARTETKCLSFRGVKKPR